ncbi:MAG: M23 family metallopeptidase, partial [Candidatus Eisenbacteria bacterium]
MLPVGDPSALGRPGPHGERPYLVTRNVGRDSGEWHAGADLSNRTGGDTVRAAAHGIVVSARDAGNGYGLHVVLAHRLRDGSLVFSVYAHLAPRSLRVASGELVTMGQPLGRVGRSGTATSPHLHFEVRRPASWDQRWEKAEALDPVRFVTLALPTRDQDSTWARPYLAWAECAGIIEPEEDGRSAVTRQRWWRALAA